ncbi:efflux RND transporter periplasmic adaptor subunit [Methylotuvimicrobium buryatense]|uniref:Efflux RND transporter periplasmic adaptor subunit n=1 Tax=Methylotuvimicrobium buryatense TaxID=95641 RepID=A0A4P9UKH1_METBY|nr:efflux RND transporter periplasmic adaptor subunit [Methylotuvimicrobium buryatense]QCW80823.1 efflux RND transporter periplasmic adaptor subunit [Methylotuvimicrobium buryatense]
MKRILLSVWAGLFVLQASNNSWAANACEVVGADTAQENHCSPVSAQSVLDLSNEQIDNLDIKLAALEKADEIPLLTASARVIVPPENEQIVSTTVAGMVSRIHVADGDAVQQGQVLAQLNSPELLALQRDYLKRASEAQLAEAVYRRDRKLQKEGIIPQSRWEETLSRFNVAKAKAQEAKQMLLITGMTETEAGQLLASRRLNSLLEISAPIGGTILQRSASVGERLTANTPLFRIANLEQLWLELSVAQDRIDVLTVGDKVKVAGTEAIAEIVLLGRHVDKQTQSVLARAVLAGPQAELRPGQTVNALAIKRIETAAFKLPQSALVQSEGRDYVFVRTGQGFEVKPAEVIGRHEDAVFIVGELDGSETVAVRGAAALKALWLESGSAE